MATSKKFLGKLLTRFALTMGAVLTMGMMPPITAAALEVHKWVDPHGVVHYSEAPPPESSADMASIETLEISNDYEPVVPPEENYYSIQNQARRLEARRLSLEQARAEQQAQEATARYEQQLQQAIVVPQSTGYDTDYDYGAGDANGYFVGSGYYYNPYYGYPVPYYPSLDHAFRNFSYNRSIGMSPRGSFVPDVKQRAPYFNPAARARMIGGEAFPLDIE